jgi:hypothetical protein
MADYRFVEDIPDLIQPDEYSDHPDGRLVRFRISVTDHGVEILGDAFRPEKLEAILATLNPDEIQQMLCG